MANAQNKETGGLEKDLERSVSTSRTSMEIHKDTEDTAVGTAGSEEDEKTPQYRADGLEKEGLSRHATESQDEPERDPNARPECFTSIWTEVLFIITATMAVGMQSLLSGSVIVVTLPIGDDLHMTAAELTWLPASSALSCGAFLLLFGRIADLFGRKTLFVGSIFGYAVVALGAGFSQTGLTLDVLNGLLGLLSAAAVPPATGALSIAYGRPSRRKNLAFACFNAGNPLGFVFGTIISGLAAKIFSWRASFWLLAIIYLVVTVVAFFTMPPDHTEKLPLNKSTLRRFDVIGALLIIAGIGLFSAALTEGGEAPQGWKTPYVLVLLILGVVLIGVFVWWDSCYEHALVPMWIWRNWTFSLLNLILFLCFMAFPPSLFWITLWMQRAWTGSALHVAAYILPAAVSGTIANITAGYLLDWVSNKLLVLGSTMILALSFMLYALSTSASGYWPFIFPALLIQTWGVDIMFNVVVMYTITALPSKHQSIAGGIVQTTARLGSTTGFGVTTAIFNAVAQNPPTSGRWKVTPAQRVAYAPYSATFWSGFAFCALAAAVTPFLKLGTQGHNAGNKKKRSNDVGEEEKANE